MKYILHSLLVLILCMSSFVDELKWEQSEWIQMVILIIPLSLGLAHSIALLFRSSLKRYSLLVAFYFLVAFGFLFSGIVASQTYVMTADLGNFGGKMEMNKIKISKGLSVLLNKEKFEDRLEIASLMYQLYGIQVFFKQENGSFQQYLPSEKEVDEFQQGITIDAERKDQIRQLIALSEQMNDYINNQLIAFIITFLLSIILFSRNPKAESRSRHG
jgi:hypothetical protein